MFRDREDAGRQLGEPVAELRLTRPLVLGIPRGGMVTGAALAKVLDAELDVVLTHKLRAPFQPELAIGAIGDDGSIYLSPEAEFVRGVTPLYLEQERHKQLCELCSRRRLFRGVRPPASITGRSAILTDDGLATGSTMFAAVEMVRAQNPCQLVVAVPVIPADRIDEVRQRCDELVYLLAPHAFWAVGQYYEVFPAVTDQQVKEILQVFVPQGGEAPTEM